MRSVTVGLFLLFFGPPAQTQGLDYFGLEPGAHFSVFLEDMKPLASPDSLICQTSPRTAKIMECGVSIRLDDRTLWLSVHVIGGVVSMLAVTDHGPGSVLDGWRQQLNRQFGDGTVTRRQMIQWVRGESVARLTWRSLPDGQRIAFTIAHDPTVARILEFLPERPQSP